MPQRTTIEDLVAPVPELASVQGGFIDCAGGLQQVKAQGTLPKAPTSYPVCEAEEPTAYEDPEAQMCVSD